MRKKKKTVYTLLRKSSLVAFGTLVFILFVGYMMIAEFYKKHFYINTFINDANCSNLTLEDAKEVVSNHANSYALTIMGRNGAKQQISGKEIELQFKYDRDINDIFESQGPYTWIESMFKEHRVQNTYEVSYNKEKLEQCIKDLGIVNSNKVQVPKDAYISAYNEKTGFTIVKEEQGNQVDLEKVKTVIEKAVDGLWGQVSLEQLDCYMKPTITSEDPQLVKTLQTMNQYMKTKITYQFGNATESFDKTKIGPAIIVGKDGSISIDEGKVKEFVTYLSRNYSTKGGTWKFQTSYGSQVTVKGGDYGWTLDEEKEFQHIMESLESADQTVRELVGKENSLTGDSSSIGDTYVEISIAKQHMFYYKNGKKVLECDIVTGNVKDGYDTPAGVYYLKYKQRDRYLRGFNADGSRYRSFVRYWMPFNGGIGLHDASWRTSFGGNIYTNSGSHGCINMPRNIAKQLYEVLQVNTPVIVY